MEVSSEENTNNESSVTGLNTGFIIGGIWLTHSECRPWIGLLFIVADVSTACSRGMGFCAYGNGSYNWNALPNLEEKNCTKQLAIEKCMPVLLVIANIIAFDDLLKMWKCFYFTNSFSVDNFPCLSMGMLEESVSPLVFSSIIYVFAFKLLSNK